MKTLWERLNLQSMQGSAPPPQTPSPDRVVLDVEDSVHAFSTSVRHCTLTGYHCQQAGGATYSTLNAVDVPRQTC